MDRQTELWLAYTREIKFSLEIVTFTLIRKNLKKTKQQQQQKKPTRSQSLSPRIEVTEQAITHKIQDISKCRESQLRSTYQEQE